MASLTDRLADGENAAFVELFDLCGSRLLNFLQWKLLSQDDARDVLQEVFLVLVRNRKRFRGVENPLAFAFQVARNESVRFIKHAIRSRDKVQLAAAEIFVASEDCPNVAVETAEWITNALSQLDERQREVIVLKVYSGFGFREISQILHTPQGTVATRYRRGLEKLREIIKVET